MRKIIKDMKYTEKGAISTLVLFTVLIFVIILMGAYMIVTTNQKSQLKSDMRIKDIYQEDVKKVDEIYNELTKYAKYDEPYIPEGFTHTEGTWNNGYVIKETSTGNEFVWVPCVLDQTKVKEGDTIVTFEKSLPKVKEDGTTDETDPYYLYNKNNYTITEDNSSINEIEQSIRKYGGFYIARYEAGIEGTQENYLLNERTSITTKPLSKEGKGVWNYISREDAITVSENMIDSETTGVKSTLITGACWDTTLRWIISSSQNAQKEPNLEYDINPIEKGWYNDVSSNTRHTTGYFSVNNIYDMAGNIWEWTTENGQKGEYNLLITRGGYYGFSASDYPTAYRAITSETVQDYIGFRVVLYKNN